MTNTKNINSTLYPHLEPFSNEYLRTDDGYEIYIEQCGNPKGTPVIVLHGGPGAGCNVNMRRFFDPHYYRIILFDQRGCGRSKPHASVENNTTWHLVEDIERIRNKFLIKKFLIFGGSWGSALGLLYAQKYPKNVSGLILRGLFTMTQRELNWFYSEGGASLFWPDHWASFSHLVPDLERQNLIKAYNKRLFHEDAKVRIKFAKAWAAWENKLASIDSPKIDSEPPEKYALAFARIENHYFINKCFLIRDNHILENLYKIDKIPGVIIQGRYDMVCPPVTAYNVHKLWTKSKLVFANASGHAMTEPNIKKALLNATESFIV